VKFVLKLQGEVWTAAQGWQQKNYRGGRLLKVA
jgi:hypothetical protein